ncbi:MAG: hypothetical protein IRZ08_16255 [Frankia sp.]|nr:hypothetical protein [Frankia sp.]
MEPFWTELLWAGGVAALLAGVCVVLRDYLSRPFWYDEIWRAHFVSEPVATFWPELANANTPSALGWLIVERLGGELFGWHTWVARLPGFVALPLLAAAIVWLGARFTGPPAAAAAALWICLSTTLLDLGTQLKPYTIETLAAVVAVALWLGGPGIARRTTAGVVSLFSVPAVFVIGPLALADVVLGGRAGRASRALATLPALALTGLHTLLFLRHQSSQRRGTYWDAHFLAGRDLGDALGFVATQLRDLVTGTPPGIDRYDPSLLHAPTDGSWLGLWLVGPAVVCAGVAGVVALARRHDGRMLLATLVGAQVAMLAASAVRYWPFGPTRTNQFVVPLIVIVVVAGAVTLVRGLMRRVLALGLARDPAGDAARTGVARAAGALVLVTALAAASLVGGVAAVARSERLYDNRDRLRGLDLTLDAAIAARRLYQPGDVVVVGGRLIRSGWIYAMEASEDQPLRPALLPPRPPQAGDREPPRVPRSGTLFFSETGTGRLARDVASLPGARRLLLFVFDVDAEATRPDLTDLTRAGWCRAGSYDFELTGTLTVLTRCPPDDGAPADESPTG